MQFSYLIINFADECKILFRLFDIRLDSGLEIIVEVSNIRGDERDSFGGYQFFSVIESIIQRGGLRVSVKLACLFKVVYVCFDTYFDT
jgi:hypothetical protein